MEYLIIYGGIAVIIFIIVTGLILWILSGDEKRASSPNKSIANQDEYLENEKIFINEVLEEFTQANIESTKSYDTKGQYFKLFKSIISSFNLNNEHILNYFRSENKLSTIDSNKSEVYADTILLKKIFAIAEGNDVKYFTLAAAQALYDLLQGNNLALTFNSNSNDNDILKDINSVLTCFDIELEFGEHADNKPFLVKLIDLSSKNLLTSISFEYSNSEYPDRIELIDNINELILAKDLMLLDVSPEEDVYMFILFDKRKYDEFNARYKDNFLALIYPEPDLDI